MGFFYGCGENGNQMKYFPIRAAKGREVTHAPANSPNFDNLKKNLLYALQCEVIKRSIRAFLQVCYKFSPLMFMSLLYPGATFSFVTPLWL